MLIAALIGCGAIAVIALTSAFAYELALDTEPAQHRPADAIGAALTAAAVAGLAMAAMRAGAPRAARSTTRWVMAFAAVVAVATGTLSSRAGDAQRARLLNAPNGACSGAEIVQLGRVDLGPSVSAPIGWKDGSCHWLVKTSATAPTAMDQIEAAFIAAGWAVEDRSAAEVRLSRDDFAVVITEVDSGPRTTEVEIEMWTAGRARGPFDPERRPAGPASAATPPTSTG